MDRDTEIGEEVISRAPLFALSPDRWAYAEAIALPFRPLPSATSRIPRRGAVSGWEMQSPLLAPPLSRPSPAAP
jgi:hypothetical protein